MPTPRMERVPGPEPGPRPPPRSLGSEMSRKASPSMLKPRTTRLRARPGKKMGHHSPRCAPSLFGPVRSAPHEGVSVGTPTPRKLMAASARMAMGT